MKALLPLLTLAFAANAGAAIVNLTFDDLSPGDSNGALVVDGFVLDPGTRDWTADASSTPSESWTGHYHIFGPGQGDANNGTNYFVFDYFLDNSVLNIFSRTNSIFGMQQLDLAEAAQSICSTDQPPSLRETLCGVTFVGQLAGGGLITRTATLDGIHDGDGALTDFETFSFDGQWNRLTMFSIESSHQYLNPGLDNIVLRTVAEPNSLALVGLTIAALIGTQRRQSRRSKPVDHRPRA